MATNRMQANKRAFATKLLTDWLAMGHRTKKYGALVTECHRRGGDETVDHLFQCCQNRANTTEFTKRLEDFLQTMKTNPRIANAMTRGVANWLREGEQCNDYGDQEEEEDTECEMGSSESDKQIDEECYDRQSKLRWRLLIRGLLDEQWSYKQERYFAKQTKDREKEGTWGDSWNAKVSAWMIIEARKMWLTRNKEVFEASERGEARNEIEACEQVRKLYELANEVGHHDRTIFDMPLEERLRLPWQTLQKWTNNTLTTVRVCIKDYQEKLKSNQRDIRGFFQRRKAQRNHREDNQENITANAKEGILDTSVDNN